MANGKSPYSDSRAISTRPGGQSHGRGTDLFEHVVYRARWDAVALEVDESHLLESFHDFLGRFSLFRERIRMSVFAKIDQGNSKCLVGTGILSSNRIERDALG